MRILYDGELYGWQATGGVNRYFANVISGLPRDFEPALLVARERAGRHPTHPNLKVYEFGHRSPVLERLSPRLGRRYAGRRDRRLWEEVAGARFDVFHPTYYTLMAGRAVNSYGAPAVVTVWDMIHELFPDEMDPAGEHAALKRSAILAADRLVCISENTKRDLLERFPTIPEARVSVTHLASDLSAELSHGPEPVPTRPFYLYVGARQERYKNFDGLLRAFARAAEVKKELALCVVGRPFTEDEERRVNELGLAGRVEHYGPAGDTHLAKLYRHSLALVYPSLYEGFGIPPLEAMACGTVAVVSNASSLPEVVGDAGLLFDPRALDELTDILLSLTENDALRRGLIEKGRLRAREFSWAKTVAQTVEVYRSVAAGS
jgi:glycosyltransferase involved in cell wall biosynthesis